MEVWKPVVGFEGFYEVSDKGRVRSLDRTIKGMNFKGKVLKLQNMKDRYKKIILWKGGVSKHFNVHRLVCIAFHKNEENKKCVNHIDGNKHNNSVSNLEWVTHSENAKHAFSTGLRVISEKNKIASSLGSTKKLSKPVRRSGKGKEEVTYISCREASEVNSINASDISQVCKGNRKTAGGFNWSYAHKELVK